MEFRIEQLGDGLRLVNSAVAINATNLKETSSARYAEIYVYRIADDQPLYAPQRVNLLDQQDLSRFLATLTTMDQHADWDAMVSKLAIEVSKHLHARSLVFPGVSGDS